MVSFPSISALPVFVRFVVLTSPVTSIIFEVFIFFAVKFLETTNLLLFAKLFVILTFPLTSIIPLFTTPFEFVSPAITPVTTKSLVILMVASAVFVKPFKLAPLPIDN